MFLLKYYFLVTQVRDARDVGPNLGARGHIVLYKNLKSIGYSLLYNAGYFDVICHIGHLYGWMRHLNIHTDVPSV
jgi:hypothetical protein